MTIARGKGNVNAVINIKLTYTHFEFSINNFPIISRGFNYTIRIIWPYLYLLSY